MRSVRTGTHRNCVAVADLALSRIVAVHEPVVNPVAPHQSGVIGGSGGNCAGHFADAPRRMQTNTTMLLYMR